MARSLHLQVLTPAETLLQVDAAQWVHVRLADGACITIYPGHAPLIAETTTASLCYADASGEQRFNARAGIVQVEDDQVTLFTCGESEPADRSAPSTAAEERRFDRLARQLNAKLERWNLDVLESHREER